MWFPRENQKMHASFRYENQKERDRLAESLASVRDHIKMDLLRNNVREFSSYSDPMIKVMYPRGIPWMEERLLADQEELFSTILVLSLDYLRHTG
jgi:hypothetical protein